MRLQQGEQRYKGSCDELMEAAIPTVGETGIVQMDWS